jgi:predicted transcriptional regulator
MNDDILEELKEQTKWLRFLAIPQLKKLMEETLITKEQKRIYDLSDGNVSTQSIQKKLLAEGLKVSHMTVYNYWRRWNALGLVIPSEKYAGRFEKIISLQQLNIEPYKVPSKK